MNENYMISIEESKTKFLLAKKELYNILELLSPIDDVISHNSRKVGVYKLLKKLVPCLDVLYNVTLAIYTRLQHLQNNYNFFYLMNGKNTIDLNKEIQQGKIVLFNLSKGKLEADASKAL